MIVMSRTRRPLVLLVLMVAIAGCETNHVCSAIGCREGLVISLDDTFAPGQTFDIEISEITLTPEVVSFMTCSFSPTVPGTPGQRLLCQSAVAHSEAFDAIQIRDYEPKRILINVSSGGVAVGERTFDPAYTSTEINGPGCGICRQAPITLSLP